MIGDIGSWGGGGDGREASCVVYVRDTNPSLPHTRWTCILYAHNALGHFYTAGGDMRSFGTPWGYEGHVQSKYTCDGTQSTPHLPHPHPPGLCKAVTGCALQPTGRTDPPAVTNRLPPNPADARALGPGGTIPPSPLLVGILDHRRVEARAGDRP